MGSWRRRAYGHTTVLTWTPQCCLAPSPTLSRWHRWRMADWFHEIVNPSDPLFEGFWLPLYRVAFPVDERINESEHAAATTAPNQHLLVEMNEGQPVAMARYDVLTGPRPRPYAYLMYMAVEELA